MDCAPPIALLMLLRTVAEVVPAAGSPLRHVLTFTGEPVIAMFAGFLFALFALGYRSGMPAERIRGALGESIKSIAGILLIIAGGGVSKKAHKWLPLLESRTPIVAASLKNDAGIVGAAAAATAGLGR